MNPQSLVRAFASAPKQVFQDKDGWIDISYITPRLIAAAGPTDNVLVGIYRSPLRRLVSHLDRNHSKAGERYWHIWNLRAEGPGYSVGSEDIINWTFLQFPDHQPPSLNMLEQIVSQIYQFLHRNPKNVALIHCKEGKGRTGTICTAYLMLEAKMAGKTISAHEAGEVFTRNRMRAGFGRGVSTLCQIRYLDYWSRVLQMNETERATFDLFQDTKQMECDTHSSKITKLLIVGPSPLLALHRIKLSTYLERLDDPNAVEIADVRTTLSHTISVSSVCEICLDRNIPLDMKELKLSFEGPYSLAYTWFNIFLEGCGKSNFEKGSNESHDFKFSIPWTDFDGFLGVQGGTPKQLFDRVEVHWNLRI